MAVGLLGRKVGMTQVFDDSGNAVAVTVIQAGPCVVVQLRTPERDGYSAVQIGFEDKPRRLASRAERGHVAELSSKRRKARQSAGKELVAKPGCEPQRMLREFRTDGEEHGCEVGQKLTVELFAEVPRVDVVGVSKGRGFTGAMKRHNFSGQRASHGVKKVHRRVGSIGMSADPSRVNKGMRMAGHHGHARITVRNMRVVRVDAENNMLVIEGAVPGPTGSAVLIRRTNKIRR